MKTATLCATALSMALSSTAFAGTYYVAPSDCQDSGPGTLAQPWCHVQHAADVALPGDTIIVRDGSYSSERVVITRGGTAGRPLTFQAEHTAAATTRGFDIYNADYIRIIGFSMYSLEDEEGIHVEGAGWCDIENNLVEYFAQGGIMLAAYTDNPKGVHNCIVKNNKVFRDFFYGIWVMGDQNEILSNEISYISQKSPCNKSTHDADWLDSDGIHYHGTGHLIKGNYIHHIDFGHPGYDSTLTCTLENLQNLNNDFNANGHPDCFQTFSTGVGDEFVPATGVIIDGNRCDNISYDPSLDISTAFINSYGGSDNKIINNIAHVYFVGVLENENRNLVANNTFVGCRGCTDLYPLGFQIFHSPNQQFFNNIFSYFDGETGAIWADPLSKPVYQSNNLIYVIDHSPPGEPHTGDVWQKDPLFVNEVAGDYHLKAGSPAIDAGTSAAGVGYDYDGVTRPQGPAVDIGAYEVAVVIGTQAPTVSSVTVTPNSTSANAPVTLTATVDDHTTGNLNIISAEYNMDGGTTWIPMNAADNIFDSSLEPVTATLTFTLAQTGTHTICIRGTDAAANISDGTACTSVTVRDTTPPVITVPGNITADATSSSGAVVTYTASATDKYLGADLCHRRPAN